MSQANHRKIYEKSPTSNLDDCTPLGSSEINKSNTPQPEIFVYTTPTSSNEGIKPPKNFKFWMCIISVMLASCLMTLEMVCIKLLSQ